MSKCPLCGARILVAVKFGGTVTVDPMPHADGDLTLTRRGISWWASKATATPYARETALYRQHKCAKPSAA